MVLYPGAFLWTRDEFHALYHDGHCRTDDRETNGWPDAPADVFLPVFSPLLILPFSQKNANDTYHKPLSSFNGNL